MLRVFCTRIPDLTDKSILNRMLPVMTEGRKKKVINFMRMEDKLRCATAEMLLRYVYTVVKENPGAQLPEIAVSEFGKPYFMVTGEPEFNLSHSGNYVVCAVSDCSVGIDAEVYSENVDLSIAKNYFSYGEYQFIIKDKRISDRSFIQIWTLKESYIKNSGMGLVIPMDSFSVEQRNGKYGVFENGIQQKKYMRLWDSYEDLAISVCTGDNEDELETLSIEWLPLENLLA